MTMRAKKDHLHATVRTELKRALEALAQRANRTLSAELELAMQAWIAERDRRFAAAAPRPEEGQ